MARTKQTARNPKHRKKMEKNAARQVVLDDLAKQQALAAIENERVYLEQRLSTLQALEAKVYVIFV